MKNRLALLTLHPTALLGVLVLLVSASFIRAQVAPVPPSQLVNLSVRAKLAAGQTLVTGFIVGGTSPARILIRGVGPTLARFGVTDAMPNPKIMLSAITPAGTVNIPEDDWDVPFIPLVTTDRVKQMRLTTSENAFPLPIGSKDAAILAELSPGAYTVTVSGVSATDVGTVLAEVYNTTPSSAAGAGRLVNLSALGTSSPEGPLLLGFVASGGTRLLFRAVGPGLTAFGVPAAVIDSQLDLLDPLGTRVTGNDNWDAGSVDGVAVSRASLAAGAFPLAAGGKDAALLLLGIGAPTVPFTLRGSGVNGTSGTMLLEIYEVPND